MLLALRYQPRADAFLLLSADDGLAEACAAAVVVEIRHLGARGVKKDSPLDGRVGGVVGVGVAS